MLGYLLGKPFTNIAEVRLLSPEEHQQICALSYKGEDSTINNTFLVRLCGSYSLSELPCETLEKAVASEIVYSTWIRRRDIHADNHVYIKGIPIFFDHQTAFLSEPQYAHITTFIRFAPDYGHPAFWRIKQITDEMTTQKARNVTQIQDKAITYVNNIDLFKNKLKIAIETLKKNVPTNLKTLIKSVGFDENQSQLIYEFLQNNLQTLVTDVRQIESIILQN